MSLLLPIPSIGTKIAPPVAPLQAQNAIRHSRRLANLQRLGLGFSGAGRAHQFESGGMWPSMTDEHTGDLLPAREPRRHDGRRQGLNGRMRHTLSTLWDRLTARTE